MVIKKSANRYKPSPSECALLFLRLIEEKEGRRRKKEGRDDIQMTRAQMAVITLQQLWNRERLSEQFLEEVQGWLLSAGWALFYAGPIFGAVKIDAVKNWPSLAAKRINPLLVEIKKGGYDFGKLERLYPLIDDDTQESDEKGDQ